MAISKRSKATAIPMAPVFQILAAEEPFGPSSPQRCASRLPSQMRSSSKDDEPSSAGILQPITTICSRLIEAAAELELFS